MIRNESDYDQVFHEKYYIRYFFLGYLILSTIPALNRDHCQFAAHLPNSEPLITSSVYLCPASTPTLPFHPHFKLILVKLGSNPLKRQHSNNIITRQSDYKTENKQTDRTRRLSRTSFGMHTSERFCLC